MKLTFQQIDTLPRLAWCARITRGSETVEVLHGPWVETADGCFSEGAWSGDFASQDFDTTLLMGSAGKVVGNTLLIAAPNHTLERLFLLKPRDGRTLLVSNSLAFVLAAADDNVNPRDLLYSVKIASITHGLKDCARKLSTRNGDTVHLYYHCNLSIDSSLRVVEEPKRPVRDFADFADYRQFLFEQVTEIQINASDPRRKIAYRPITTISAGYDSPAAAVLARSVGCSEALTFSTSRGRISDDTNDSGAPIAAALGMVCHEFDRLEYLKLKGFPEAEFLGWGAQEAPWAGHLEGRVVFTGFHGGRVWDRNNKRVSSHIVRGDPSGHNMAEFRLSVGWIHLPVAYLGCTSHPAIHRISNSEEMAPWTLHNGYDKPIARRLVEEAGVDRQAFGTKKRAVGVDLVTEGLRERLTEESFDDYTKYYQARWTGWMTAKQWIFARVRRIYLRHVALNARLSGMIKRRLGVEIELPILMPREMRIGSFGDLDHLALLVHWSIEKTLPDYRTDMSRPRSGRRNLPGDSAVLTQTRHRAQT